MVAAISQHPQAGMTRLFVYGTLLRGLSRAQMLRGSRLLGPALLSGRLFDLGSYPGLLAGPGLVVGEIYLVDTSALQRLDRVEDFDARDPEGSLYRRETVSARHFSGRGETVQSYFYNGEPDAGIPIPHGDYRRYLIERRPGAQPAVAYGSNLSLARIETRIGPVGRRRAGRLEGFRLSLDKRAAVRHNVVANIRYTGADDCPGALHDLSLAQLQLMDRFEGTPNHYLRIVLPFRPNGRSGIRLAHTWIAHPDRVTAGLPVRAEYLSHLRSGYAQFGWSEAPITRALEALQQGNP
ncbi:MAG: gamma-glutamylcyclotransferase [Thioalkalivibrio sp.]|nr:gamma-glutamylcyclotransferase [Thioalkalivibrio sp.]